MYDRFKGIGDDKSGSEDEDTVNNSAERAIEIYRQRGNELFEEKKFTDALAMFLKTVEDAGPSRRKEEVNGHISSAMCLIELNKWDEVLQHCNAILDSTNGPSCGQEENATKYKAVALAKKGEMGKAIGLLRSYTGYQEIEEMKDLITSINESIASRKENASSSSGAMSSSDFKKLLVPDETLSPVDKLKLAQILAREGDAEADGKKYAEIIRLCPPGIDENAPKVKIKVSHGASPEAATEVMVGNEDMLVWRYLWARAVACGGKYETESAAEYLELLEKALPVLVDSALESDMPTIRELGYVILATSVLASGHRGDGKRCERYRMQALATMDNFIHLRPKDKKSLLPRRGDARKEIAILRKEAGDDTAYEKWSLAAAADLLAHGRNDMARSSLLAVAEHYAQKEEDAAFDIDRLEQRWRDRGVQDESDPKWDVPRVDSFALCLRTRDADAKAFMQNALYGAAHVSGSDDHTESSVRTWLAYGRWGASSEERRMERAISFYRAGLLARNVDDVVKHLDAAISAAEAAEREPSSEEVLHRGDMLYHLSLALLLRSDIKEAITVIDSAFKIACNVKPATELTLDRARACLGQKAVAIAAQALHQTTNDDVVENDVTAIPGWKQVTDIMTTMKSMKPQGPDPTATTTHDAMISETTTRIQKLIKTRTSQSRSTGMKPMTEVVEPVLPPLPAARTTVGGRRDLKEKLLNRLYVTMIPLLISSRWPRRSSF